MGERLTEDTKKVPKPSSRQQRHYTIQWRI